MGISYPIELLPKEIKIIPSMFGIKAYAYTKAENRYGCCIGKEFHQRCSCSVSITDCKLLYNQDTKCKGYVQTNYGAGDGCNIATTSNCPSGCYSDNIGTVGDLTLDGTCGYTSHLFGCFIKEHGT